MNRMRIALFLDRDGVINVDKGYVGRKEAFEFIDGIFDIANHAHSLGYLLVIVTNQTGIARGFYIEDGFRVLMDWVVSEFEKRGAPIAGVYFCPYHPDGLIEHYRRDSFDRTPNPGMLFRSSEEIEMNRSDEADRQATSGASVHGGLQHPGSVEPPRHCHLPRSGEGFYAQDGHCGVVPKTQHDDSELQAQGVSLPASSPCHYTTQRGLVCRHHLHTSPWPRALPIL